MAFGVLLSIYGYILHSSAQVPVADTTAEGMIYWTQGTSIHDPDATGSFQPAYLSFSGSCRRQADGLKK